MQKRRNRILITLLAIFFGFGLVYILSYSGGKTKGPLKNFFDRIGQSVQDFEKRNIMDQRSEKRSDKLVWFANVKSDIDFIKNPTRILLGAFDNESAESFESVIDLEDSLKTTFPLMQVYTAWGSKDEQKFPMVKVQTILKLGSLPVITWEPWLTDFDAEEYPQLRERNKRDRGGLKDIANGLYDDYITEWATDAAEVKQPILLRFGHEMNDPYRYPWGPHNNRPEDFISAWKHVHDLFIEHGANNIIWVWCPHPAHGLFDLYYPGSEYVDYTGVGVLNYGTVAHWSEWWDFKDIFGQHYDDLAAFNKPIMITEFGSLAVGGNRGTWYHKALNNLPENYPMVKCMMFFHFSKDNTLTQQELNWYFIDDSTCVANISNAIHAWGETQSVE